MSQHLKTAKSLNTAVLVLSIIGIVATVLLLFFGVFVLSSASFIDYTVSYYQAFGGIGIIILSLVYLIIYIFSVVCAGVISGSIKKGIATGAPFVLAILNAVFCGLSGRYITMVLAIITAVKLNSAKKEALPNI